MTFTTTLLLFGLIVVATHFLEGVTGFGSTALSMPFSVMLLGASVAKPILTFYAMLTCLYILLFSYQQVDWKAYFKMMFFLLLGLPVGILLYDHLTEQILMISLSIFMMLIAIRGILIEFKIYNAAKPLKEIWALVVVFLGGVVHGAYSSGGPLIIVYATEKMKDKTRFRATLCLIWVTLNTIIIAQMLIAKKITTDVLRYGGYAFVFLVIGTVLGAWAHNHIHNDMFKKITFIVLFVMGAITLGVQMF